MNWLRSPPLTQYTRRGHSCVLQILFFSSPTHCSHLSFLPNMKNDWLQILISPNSLCNTWVLPFLSNLPSYSIFSVLLTIKLLLIASVICSIATSCTSAVLFKYISTNIVSTTSVYTPWLLNVIIPVDLRLTKYILMDHCQRFTFLVKFPALCRTAGLPVMLQVKIWKWLMKLRVLLECRNVQVNKIFVIFRFIRTRLRLWLY